ncbi:hypothetical protein RJ55_06162 [Drechmeria coniospora]|nr:hypothetical protein RJ55_06162 [Drechmeria coniospora]
MDGKASADGIASATQPDADEFGLPVRKYRTPEPDSTTGDAVLGESRATADPAARHETNPKQRETAAGDGSATRPLPDPRTTTRGADDDGDEAILEDAPAAIPPGSAVPSTKPSPAPQTIPPEKDAGPQQLPAEPTSGGAEDTTDADTPKMKNRETPEEASAPAGSILGSQPSHPKEGEASPLPAETRRVGVDDAADAADATPKMKHRETPEDTPEESPSPAASVDGAQHSSPMSAGKRRHSAARSRTTSLHSRSNSTVSNASVSEHSHQALAMQPEEEEPEEDEGWQTMPSYARYDMYDDDNRLIAREHDEEEDEKYTYGGLGGAGKGYTRVDMDDDVQSATSMDDNTQYLFKGASRNDLVDDEEGRDAVSQMEATKDLLTEGQRVAYVGLVRLEIARMVEDAEELGTTKKTKKALAIGVESLRMWGQKMMIRLYAHMDISEAEQLMIEQLDDHGVMPGDLTPALHANSRVRNPMAEDKGTTDKAATATDVAKSSGSSSPSSGEEDAAKDPAAPYESVESSEDLDVQTPSQLPTTQKIDIDLRWTVLCDLFLILIADSIYDARSRVLLERAGASLDISWIDICRFEKKVTDALEMQQAAEKENWNEDEHMEARRKLALKKRYVMMGLATVGGGLVIGLSAGLLAPVIGAGLAAGFTTIGVTGTSSFLAGAGGAAIITSSAAASGSLIGGRAANRRMGAVKTFEYRPLHNNKRVNLIVTVSGWLTGKVDDVRLPFSTVNSVMGDVYSVLFEPEMLRSMGDTINILATEALTQGLQQILGSTILVSLMAALQLPIVLTKLSYLIDNPWAVSLDRAWAAGLILADSLQERSLGTRPITLVGYSIGARVIFSCLQELAKKGAYGVVQNVYMFGSPIVVKKEEYRRAKSIVPGRFVNGFNRNDWILGYLFRLTSGGIRRVAGLAAIEDCPWMENMDVTDEVAGHMEYRRAMPKLLIKCGWEVDSEEFTEIEDPDPENHKERQRELINEIEEARKELEKSGKAKKGGRFGLFGRRKKAGRQEWEVYEDTAGKGAAAAPGGGTEADGGEGGHHGVLFDIDAIRAELAREAGQGATEEELQVREIKSTLPPMRLQLTPMSSPSPAPPMDRRGSLRETRSADELGLHVHVPDEGTTSPLRLADEHEHGEEEIQMTFDSPFHEESSHSNEELRRPTTKPTLADPWADEDEEFGKEKEISMTFA